MATGLSTTAADEQLDALVAIYDFMQLHTGDPGSAGTANVATENTRQAVTWGSASGAEVANSADVEWTDVAAAETYTHFTMWTLVSGGVFGFSGEVTANAVGLGDDFRVATGDLTAAYDTAS